jgi:hypothetical protein
LSDKKNCGVGKGGGNKTESAGVDEERFEEAAAIVGEKNLWGGIGIGQVGGAVAVAATQRSAPESRRRVSRRPLLSEERNTCGVGRGFGWASEWVWEWVGLGRMERPAGG